MPKSLKDLMHDTASAPPSASSKGPAMTPKPAAPHSASAPRPNNLGKWQHPKKAR